MTPAEVEAVLALWGEVEGTQPRGFLAERIGPCPVLLFPIGLPVDQAYDALCGHLRRWLEERWADFSIRHRKKSGYLVSWVLAGKDQPFMWASGKTLLLALIAAVRAVAGTTGQPQTQGGASIRDANTTRTVFPGLGSATSYEVAGDLKRALSTGAAQMPGGQDDPNTPTAADAAGETK